MRALTRLLAAVLALALLAFGVILTIEVIAAAVGASPVVIPWRGAYDAGRRDAWDDTGTVVLCSLLAAGGLVALLTQLAPRRVRDRALADRDDGVTASVSITGLQRALAAAARSVDGVSTASVALGRRSARVHATARGTGAEEADRLTQSVETAVSGLLDRLAFRQRPEVSVSVRPRKGSS